jgi:hypothetical protein
MAAKDQVQQAPVTAGLAVAMVDQFLEWVQERKLPGPTSGIGATRTIVGWFRNANHNNT